MRIALFIFFVIFTCRIFAATWYVNDASLSGDIYCSAVGNDSNPGTAALPKLTLTAVISAASSGDIIYVDAGTYTDTEIDFRSSAGTSIFTIVGAGSDLTIFDGSSDTKSFEQSTYTWELTISDLTIDNYYASSGGTAFDITANRKLTLNDVVISNSRNGQAVTLSVGSSSTSLLSVTGGGFFCNSAGAIIVSGGYSGSGYLTLTDVAFINNSGLSYGSALLIGEASGFADSTPDDEAKLSKCVISGCLFEDNSGSNTSCVYIHNICSSGCGTDNVDYLIEDCIFRNNTVSSGGSSYGGTVSLRLDNNSWLINHCLFEGNVNASSRGTLAIHTGNLDVTNSKFDSNTTTSSEGKDFYAYYALSSQEGSPYYLNDPTVDINNCFFNSVSDNISRNSSQATINLVESGTPTNTSDYSGDGLSQTYTWVDVDELLWTGDCGIGYALSSGDYYWIGGTGDWSDYSNHWSTTSGGSADQTAYPTSTSNVYFDANSDVGNTAFTVTMDVNGEAKNFNYDSDYTTFSTSTSKTLSATNLYVTGGNLTIDNVNTTVSTTSDVDATLTLNTATYNDDGTFDATGGTIDFTGSGTLTLSSTATSLGTLDDSEGTVEYDGTTQTVLSDSYNNLTISTAGIKTASDSIDVNGNLTTAATTNCELDMGTYQLNIAGNLSVGATDGLDLSDASSLIVFDGSTDQTITHAGTSGIITNAGSNTTNYAIPDATSYIQSVINLSSSLNANDLKSVTINITHTWASDLDITLYAPDGSYIDLSSDNGGSDNDYNNTTFSSSGTTSITSGSAPFTGTFTPEEPFSNLTGSANGNWILRVADDTGGDTGDLLDWNLELEGVGGSGYEINNLAINKSSGNLILNNQISVDGTITFTSGDIDASSNDLVLTSNATIPGAGANNSSHVIGVMKKTTSAISSFTFPTGDGSNYRPIIVSPATATSTVWTAEYVNTAHPDTDVDGSGLHHILQQEYWNLDRDVATDATIGLTWTSANNLTDYQQLRIAHYDGTTDWDMITSTPVGNNTSGTITSDADVTTFSPFTLGSATSANPLPVKLVTFEGFPINKFENKLEWSTSTENNADYINIEKLNAYHEFETIGFQKLAENSLEQLHYEYIDRNVENKINYYRLKQFDIDGAFYFSKTISIDNRKLEEGKVSFITNLLGQKVDKSYKGIVILNYENGARIKTIQ